VGARYDELSVAGLTLQGVATGGVKTCLMVPEIRTMFDVAPAVRGQQKYNRILVSHGHHDHLGGLPYLCSQRQMMGQGPPAVHAPVELVEPFRKVIAAWREIEDYEIPVTLHGHAPGDVVDLTPKLQVRCVRSVHRIASLCWIVRRTVDRLKPEYAGLSGPEIGARRQAGEQLTESHTSDVLAVTGDTQIELVDRNPELWSVDVLVHEVTGWDDSRPPESVRRYGHTHVDEVIERAEQFTGRALVLVHRSPRNSRKFAEKVVATRFPASVRDRVHLFG